MPDFCELCWQILGKTFNLWKIENIIANYGKDNLRNFWFLEFILIVHYSRLSLSKIPDCNTMLRALNNSAKNELITPSSQPSLLELIK